MKKAGDLLPFFFEEYTTRIPHGITRMFSSWAVIAKEHRMPAAIDHARIVELERNIILIEADHPGWIQILQTKQQGLLESFRRRFPELTITGISFRLSKGVIQAKKDDEKFFDNVSNCEDVKMPKTGEAESGKSAAHDVLSKFENNDAFKKMILKLSEL